MPVSESEVHAVRAYVLPPEKSAFLFTGPNAGLVVASPDGRRLAFTASHRERTLLFVRPIDSLAAQPLAGTEGASFNDGSRIHLTDSIRSLFSPVYWTSSGTDLGTEFFANSVSFSRARRCAAGTIWGVDVHRGRDARMAHLTLHRFRVGSRLN